MEHRKLLNEELNRLTTQEYKQADKCPIVVVLDNVRSLNNIGSVFRTSDAFRIEKIYLCGITATPPHREIHKTALGAEECVAWEYFQDTVEAIKELKAEGFTIVSVEQVENSLSLENYTIDLRKKYAYVFGNEVKGVDQNVVNFSDYCLELPQFGTKHSFNISVTVGIVLWQVLHPLFTNLYHSCVEL